MMWATITCDMYRLKRVIYLPVSIFHPIQTLYPQGNHKIRNALPFKNHIPINSYDNDNDGMIMMMMKIDIIMIFLLNFAHTLPLL